MASPHILRSYRELFRLIKRLPEEAERQAARLQAQVEMRKHAHAEQEQAADLHRVLVSKISFLRMRVPKMARDAGKVGVGKYVVRDGKVVEGVGESAGIRCALASASHINVTPRHRVVPD